MYSLVRNATVATYYRRVVGYLSIAISLYCTCHVTCLVEYFCLPVGLYTSDMFNYHIRHQITFTYCWPSLHALSTQEDFAYMRRNANYAIRSISCSLYRSMLVVLRKGEFIECAISI